MKKAIRIIILIMLLIEVLGIKTVYALNFEFTVTANKPRAKAGDEILISMRISDIDMGDLRDKCYRKHIRL